MNSEPTTAPAPPTAAPGLRALTDLDPRAPLTATELAAVLGCHVKTVHRSVSKGELPAPFKFLGRKRWTAGAVLDFMAKRQAAAISAD